MDTTSNVIARLLHLPGTYPAAQSKLREEILDIVGPTRRPSYEDIRNMKYLRAVINETLRLYPPV